MKKRKPSASVEHRLTKLEIDTKGLYEDLRALSKRMDEKLDEIKENITNNLVNKIDATNVDLKTLLDRKNDQEAIKNFLNHLLKICGSFAALSWAVVSIISALKDWGILK